MLIIFREQVEDYQQAIRDMEDGSTIKPVLLW
jgi:hypothetical protein